MNFINTGLDDQILKSMDAEYNPSDDLVKAMSKQGLVQKEIQVKGKNGQTFTRKQWVKASDNKTDSSKGEPKSSKITSYKGKTESEMRVLFEGKTASDVQKEKGRIFREMGEPMNGNPRRKEFEEATAPLSRLISETINNGTGKGNGDYKTLMDTSIVKTTAEDKKSSKNENYTDLEIGADKYSPSKVSKAKLAVASAILRVNKDTKTTPNDLLNDLKSSKSIETGQANIGNGYSSDFIGVPNGVPYVVAKTSNGKMTVMNINTGKFTMINGEKIEDKNNTSSVPTTKDESQKLVASGKYSKMSNTSEPADYMIQILKDNDLLGTENQIHRNAAYGSPNVFLLNTSIKKPNSVKNLMRNLSNGKVHLTNDNKDSFDGTFTSDDGWKIRFEVRGNKFLMSTSTDDISKFRDAVSKDKSNGIVAVENASVTSSSVPTTDSEKPKLDSETKKVDPSTIKVGDYVKFVGTGEHAGYTAVIKVDEITSIVVKGHTLYLINRYSRHRMSCRDDGTIEKYIENESKNDSSVPKTNTATKYKGNYITYYADGIKPTGHGGKEYTHSVKVSDGKYSKTEYFDSEEDAKKYIDNINSNSSSQTVPTTKDEIQKLVASGKSKEDIMKIAKDSGVTWKEHDHAGINWMRCCMALTGTSTKGTK